MGYATVADYLAWMDATVAPTGLTRLLDVASNRVDELLVGAVYSTDYRGMPTDMEIVDVLRRATCEQAAYMLEAGDESGTGAGRPVTSQTIGRISWTANSTGGAASGGGRVARYAPEAVSVLHVAGLLPVAVIR